MTTDSNRIVYDLSFVGDSIDDLPYDQRTPNMVKLLTLVAERFDSVQTTAIDLAYMRFLDNAPSAILDQIAERFFITRGNKSDDTLRTEIKLFALRQTSQGTRDDIVNILRIISGVGGYLKIYKAENNYIQVAVSVDCLELSEIRINVEELFPFNTNLQFHQVDVRLKPFGFGDSQDSSFTNNSISGFADSRTPFYDQDNGSMSRVIINSSAGV